ncbi:MAG: ATPase, T2SS/T4P/T4SS family, partial [Polyangiales bacterium]
ETIAAAVTAAETGHLVLSTLHSGTAHGAIDRIVDVFPEHQQRQVRGQLADVLRLVITQRLIPSRDGGRVPAVELLPVNFAVANLIREGKTFQIPQVLQTGRDAGMVPLARAVADLVKSGAVDREVAMRHVPDPQHLLEQLRGR